MKMVMGDPTSALVAMGQASNNHHAQNPNKNLKINVICTSLHAIKKTTAYNTWQTQPSCAMLKSIHGQTLAAPAPCSVWPRRPIEVQMLRDFIPNWKTYPSDLATPPSIMLTRNNHWSFSGVPVFGNKMEDSLIKLNQIWANDLVINTCPK